MLFEMLQGEVIRDGWKSREVFDALDLCLSCKGCTSDCPVHVDMPTLKAEFLYQYYKGFDRNRKRYMYAFGAKKLNMAMIKPVMKKFAGVTRFSDKPE